MTFSLYDATIPVFLQVLGSVSGLLDKAEAWTAEKQVSELEIIDFRLVPDMLPFSYQVKSVVIHSVGAIQSVPSGQFSPDRSEPPQSFQGLKERVAQAIDSLEALTPEEVNAFVGSDMAFLLGEFRMEFTSADAFLMGFSMPNIMFHASTAYNLLRLKGLEIGKRDFLGAMPLKR